MHDDDPTTGPAQRHVGASPLPLPDAPARLCARVGCGATAVATLTADYGDRVMAVGPLSPERTPPASDLCAEHRDRLRPPAGWELIRHTPRGADAPA